VALVVGNSNYTAVPRLPNPSRDASAVGKMFKDAGFQTIETYLDVGNLDFKRAIRRFEDIAAAMVKRRFIVLEKSVAPAGSRAIPFNIGSPVRFARTRARPAACSSNPPTAFLNLQKAPETYHLSARPINRCGDDGRANSVSSKRRREQRGLATPAACSEVYLLAVSFFAMLTTCTRRFSAALGSALFFRSVSP
jgi:hypothetical protein